MVSFVPPVPGRSDGTVARTLPSMPVMSCPGCGLPITAFGRMSVITPSEVTLLAGSSEPMVVKTRAAPCATPVLPYVNAGVGPSEVTIDTNQSSAVYSAVSGGFCGALKRTAHRPPGGMVERLATLMVKTILPANESGSATSTEVMSCCGSESDSSPVGSLITSTPGSEQAPVGSRRGPTVSSMMLLKPPAPTALIARTLYVYLATAALIARSLNDVLPAVVWPTYTSLPDE